MRSTHLADLFIEPALNVCPSQIPPYRKSDQYADLEMAIVESLANLNASLPNACKIFVRSKMCRQRIDLLLKAILEFLMCLKYIRADPMARPWTVVGKACLFQRQPETVAWQDHWFPNSFSVPPTYAAAALASAIAIC